MPPPGWLTALELRIGLGCMRLSSDDIGDDQALAAVAAAVAAGITVFDTAHAYGHGAEPMGQNERLLARALQQCVGHERARIVTKGGMTRSGGGWVADGRARTIRADCEASLAALGGLPIDTYLIHAPDPRTPWRTSVRALAALVDDGLVARVGVCNVNRGQLDEALELAPVAAVEVALSAFDDDALRGGVVERCTELGVTVIAHSPLGGPRRARTLARRLADLDLSGDVTAAEAALAWVLEVSPAVVAIPGARRPATIRSAVRAASVRLTDADRTAFSAAFALSSVAGHRAPRPRKDAEVVLVMGIPGAGKTTAAAAYVARGHVRLNRDERGGSLGELSQVLDGELSGGADHVVLDNTWLTRAARSRVIEVAAQHGVAARCVWIDTPLAQAQRNVVERMLDRFGALPGPAELRDLARHEPGVMAPTSQMRAARELEAPSRDEGFASVERVAFARRPSPATAAAAVLVAASALERPGWEGELERVMPDAPHLVCDWQPGADADVMAAAVSRVAAHVTGLVEGAVCPHPGGPPQCWCRPPLPGLALAFARVQHVDVSRSVVVGASAAHRAMAATLGAAYMAL